MLFVDLCLFFCFLLIFRFYPVLFFLIFDFLKIYFDNN